MSHSVEFPLAGIYILDFVPGPLAALGRHLAELGADVVRVEPPAGQCDRSSDKDLPAWLDFATLNIGKRATVVDSANEHDSARLCAMLKRADVVLLDASPGAAFAIDPSALREHRPECVVVSVSNYGIGNDLSDWQLTDPILHALGGNLALSGIAGMPPVLPPVGVAEGCAAAQGLWVTLCALYRALKTGEGDHLDFALLDGAMQAFDPGFGVGGSAALGARPADLPPGRPEKGYWYPVLGCADGRVRLCVLAPRQWDRLYDWMGKPEAFADPKYRDLYTRLGTPELWDCVAVFFADKSCAELEKKGEELGVPVVTLLSLTEVVKHPHLAAREAIARLPLPGEGAADLPSGSILVDGVRMAPRRGVPALGDDDGLPIAPKRRPEPSVRARRTDNRQPLAGLKVLDMGVIVAGAEQGRVFADMGADVVKVESQLSPDSTRRPLSGLRMVPSFAAGHRNKRGLGLNLKDPRGRQYFLDLAAQADVILSNFKPGTLEKMGLSYVDISKVNPRIVMAESSAFGATGPLSSRMGYGPLVRAMSGLTHGWHYPDNHDLYTDQVVVYPDHVAGRYVAAGAMALLIRQLLGGRGGSASVAQLEVILNHLSRSLVRSSAGQDTGPSDLPWGVYHTAGEDNWLVISVRNPAEWEAFVTAIGQSKLAIDPRFSSPQLRREHRGELDKLVADWCKDVDANEAMDTLQNAGVPAGMMLRIPQLPEWPHLRERRLFRTETHPLLEYPLITDNVPVLADNIPEPGFRPAPERGEHTREVLREWLQLEESEIQQMIDESVFEEAEAVSADKQHMAD